jgi:hypothetical protein
VQPPIYIVGISPRCGTNFLFDLLRLHPAVDVAQTVPEDFLLFGAHHLQGYVDGVADRWDMDWGMSESDTGELLGLIGEAGLQFLQRRQAHPEKRLLTKTPEAHNLPMIFELFPEVQPIIIVRDGRAVVESKMNSFDADFAYASRGWAAAAQWILDFMQKTPPDRFRLVKYEDVYQRTHETMDMLLEYLNLEAADYPFDTIDSLPVRGSSVHFGESGKLDWQPVEKTDAFNPLDRFSEWPFQQHIEFNVLAGEQMVRLGYALQEPEFQKVELDRTAYDKETDIITRLDSGARVLMPRESADLLLQLDSFRGLHEHFNQSQLDPGELPKFIQFYENCAGAGLLLEREDFLAGLASAHSEDGSAPAGLFGVFIRTCERPAYLERILASLQRPGAGRVFVLDDSRDAEARRANAAIVEKFARDAAPSVFYLGEEWQRGFIARLVAAYPDHEEVIRYLLEPRPEGVFSAGRVLNLAMLALAGKRVLTYDDDYIVDRCWQHPEAEHGVLRIAGERAHCLQGFATEDDMFGMSRDLQLDPVAEHEALLGRTVSSMLSLVQQTPHSVCLTGVGGSFARKLGPDSRILTTGNGVMGKPIAPDGLLGWLAGVNTIPVWAPGKDYQGWLEGDHIFTSHKSPTISQTTFGIPVGIDNSNLMPPTLPEGRREDSLFTFMLHHAHSAGVHFEFPWAVSHERDPLQWRWATVEKPQAMALAQFIMLCLQETVSSSVGRGSAEAALATFGATLKERSLQSERSLRRDLLKRFQVITSQHHVRLMEVLQRPDMVDPAVAADVERALQVSREYQQRQPARVLWEDSHCPTDAAQQLNWVRENLQLFGQALEVWPELWCHCRNQSEFDQMDVSVGSVAAGQ